MEGNNTHRHAYNPLEKEYHDLFLKHFRLEGLNKYSTKLEKIISYNCEDKKDMTERETKLVLNFCQWLGSPAGQGFLKEMTHDGQGE